MTDHRKDIAQALIDLEESYPNHKPLSQKALRDYVDDLEGFGIEQIAYAIREHRRMSKWYPSIAEICALAPSYRYSGNQDKASDWEPLNRLRHNAMKAHYAGEPTDLEGLARLFDLADRPDGAASIRSHIPKDATL